MEEELTPGAVPYGRRIRDLAEAEPDGVGLIAVAADGSERPLTWADLDRRSNQVARAFADRGVDIGDRVGLQLRNSPELVLGILAAWKLGAAPVAMRWDLPEWERARLVEVLAGRLVVTDEDDGLLDAGGERSSEPLPDVEPPHAWGICTSGSTGTPKVIVKTFPGVYDPTAQPLAAEYGPVERPQVVLAPAPLYHTNGFASVLNLIGGDRVVLMERFDATLVLDLIERHRVTTFTATSTMLQRIAAVEDIDDRDLSSIRSVLQGAAVIAPSLVHRWLDLVGPERFLMAYGMTEGLGLTLIRGDEWLTHPGSVGRGVRETEIRVLGEDGADLPSGEVGEIFLRSPAGQAYTYLGAVADLPITADGFATAGDLGSLDEDGFLTIADRRVDMIITGGANVYPAEVENALGDHPGVADVVVVGLADPEWGRRVHAIVAPTDASAPPTAAEIVAFAKQRLAPYKVPKTVEVVDDIPRSAATKVSRRALVEERGG